MYRYWYAFAVCWIWSVVVLLSLAGRGLTFHYGSDGESKKD